MISQYWAKAILHAYELIIGGGGGGRLSKTTLTGHNGNKSQVVTCA